MGWRRKLTIEEYFDRIEAGLRLEAARPRRRISNGGGVLFWKKGRLKAGVHVSPQDKAVFVFLGGGRTIVNSPKPTIALLRAIFAGEIIEVEADGPNGGEVWLAPRSAPAQHMNRYNADHTSSDVPLYTGFHLRSWV